MDITIDALRKFCTTRRLTCLHSFQISLPNPQILSHKSSFLPRTCNPRKEICLLLSFHESYNLSFCKPRIKKLDFLLLLLPYPCLHLVSFTMGLRPSRPFSNMINSTHIRRNNGLILRIDWIAFGYESPSYFIGYYLFGIFSNEKGQMESMHLTHDCFLSDLSLIAGDFFFYLKNQSIRQDSAYSAKHHSAAWGKCRRCVKVAHLLRRWFPSLLSLQSKPLILHQVWLSFRVKTVIQT